MKKEKLTPDFIIPTPATCEGQATPHWIPTRNVPLRRESHHIKRKLSTTEFEDCLNSYRQELPD